MQTEPLVLESACLTSDHFEDKRVAGKIILKVVLGSDLEGTGWDEANWLGLVTVCCEHGSEHSGYIMFLQLWLFEKGCTPWCLLIPLFCLRESHNLVTAQHVLFHLMVCVCVCVCVCV